MGILMTIIITSMVVLTVLMLTVAIWSWTQYKVYERKVELVNEDIRNREW